MSQNDFIKELIRMRGHLNEANRCLKFGEEGSFEAKLAKLCEKAKNALDDTIMLMKQ